MNLNKFKWIWLNLNVIRRKKMVTFSVRNSKLTVEGLWRKKKKLLNFYSSALENDGWATVVMGWRAAARGTGHGGLNSRSTLHAHRLTVPRGVRPKKCSATPSWVPAPRLGTPKTPRGSDLPTLTNPPRNSSEGCEKMAVTRTHRQPADLPLRTKHHLKKMSSRYQRAKLVREFVKKKICTKKMGVWRLIVIPYNGRSLQLWSVRSRILFLYLLQRGKNNKVYLIVDKGLWRSWTRV